MTADRPAWVIEQSLETSAFTCCTDQDLLPFKCASCHHPFVLCYECDTLYAHLPDTSRQEPFTAEARACPSCRHPLPPRFQRDPHCRVTFDEWTGAGLGALLSDVPMETLGEMLVESTRQVSDLLERNMFSTARVRVWELRNLGEAIAPHFAGAARRRTEAREQGRQKGAFEVIRWTKGLPEPLERAYATLGVADIVLPEQT